MRRRGLEEIGGMLFDPTRIAFFYFISLHELRLSEFTVHRRASSLRSVSLISKLKMKNCRNWIVCVKPKYLSSVSFQYDYPIDPHCLHSCTLTKTQWNTHTHARTHVKIICQLCFLNQELIWCHSYCVYAFCHHGSFTVLSVHSSDNLSTLHS